MKSGFLNDYFLAVAVKRLSAVEADPETSNQHEYNGVAGLKQMFGTDLPKKILPTDFLYLSDEDDLDASGVLTWYDARYNHPTRTEWRLYYPTNEVTVAAAAGDSLFICLKKDGGVLQIEAKAYSIVEGQLFWLFGIRPAADGRFVTATDLENPQAERAVFVARSILEKIGIELPSEEVDFTAVLLDRFGTAFPSTMVFCEFARSTVTGMDPQEEPDETLLAWYDRAEVMFKCMEKIVIRERLERGFMNGSEVDVDAFIKYSLSVNNRRKSRAGLSFENNLNALFDANGIKYSHTPVTENRSRPDYIFPCIDVYRNPSFPVGELTMLGAKTTAKDRWRQVLEEADKIGRKHLITLEGAISENQTIEMRSRNLQLVVPRPIVSTFTPSQQEWICTVKDFIGEVLQKQRFYQYWLRIKSD